MILKLVFFDETNNNEYWWNRLWDRFNKIQNRKWSVVGGGSYGSKEAIFYFTDLNGIPIKTQEAANEIVWCFIIDQISIEQFIVNNQDVTKQLTNR